MGIGPIPKTYSILIAFDILILYISDTRSIYGAYIKPLRSIFTIYIQLPSIKSLSAILDIQLITVAYVSPGIRLIFVVYMQRLSIRFKLVVYL